MTDAEYSTTSGSSEEGCYVLAQLVAFVNKK